MYVYTCTYVFLWCPGTAKWCNNRWVGWQFVSLTNGRFGRERERRRLKIERYRKSILESLYTVANPQWIQWDLWRVWRIVNWSYSKRPFEVLYSYSIILRLCSVSSSLGIYCCNKIMETECSGWRHRVLDHRRLKVLVLLIFLALGPSLGQASSCKFILSVNNCIFLKIHELYCYFPTNSHIWRS